MVIGIVNFPDIKPGKEAGFLEWFAWSNKQFAVQPGFISRRLMKQPVTDGKYAAIIEFETLEQFNQVAKQPFHAQSAWKLAGLLEEMPAPALYTQITTDSL